MDKKNSSKKFEDQRYKEKTDATSRCLEAVRKFVHSEVSKGKGVEEAIETVLSNTAFQKIYPQINDPQIRKYVLRNIRSIYYYGSGSDRRFGIKWDTVNRSDDEISL